MKLINRLAHKFNMSLKLNKPTDLNKKIQDDQELNRQFIEYGSGIRMYAVHSEPGYLGPLSTPDPKEFGYPAEKRRQLMGEGGSVYTVLDDGSHHWIQKSVFSSRQTTDTSVARAQFHSRGNSSVIADRSSWTSLMHAINDPRSAGKEDTIVSNYSAQWSKTDPRTNQTALHNAVINNKIDFVRALLEKGISFSVVDNKGRTPLALAAASGQREITTLLITHILSQPGMSTEQSALVKELNRKDKNNMTPMMLAARNGQPTLYQLGRYAYTSSDPVKDIDFALSLSQEKLNSVSPGKTGYTPQGFVIARQNKEFLEGLAKQYKDKYQDRIILSVQELN